MFNPYRGVHSFKHALSLSDHEQSESGTVQQGCFQHEAERQFCIYMYVHPGTSHTCKVSASDSNSAPQNTDGGCAAVCISAVLPHTTHIHPQPPVHVLYPTTTDTLSPAIRSGAPSLAPMLLLPPPQVALVDIRGQVVKHRDEGSDFFSTRYEGMEADYLDAHIPGAVFVDWTKVNHAVNVK